MINWYKIAQSEIPNNGIERKIIAYHGTRQPFESFDIQHAPMGVFWFSENIESIKDESAGALSNKYIATVELKVEKTAGREDYEKYFLQQLEDMGYDSINLEEDWVVFDTDRIRILDWYENF
jgi:hypothetical protein